MTDSIYLLSKFCKGRSVMVSCITCVDHLLHHNDTVFLAAKSLSHSQQDSLVPPCLQQLATLQQYTLQCMFFNLNHPGLIPHLQRQATQYLASQRLHLCLTLGGMQVAMWAAYLKCHMWLWAYMSSSVWEYESLWNKFLCAEKQAQWSDLHLF